VNFGIELRPINLNDQCRTVKNTVFRHTHTHTLYGSLDFVWDKPGESVKTNTKIAFFSLECHANTLLKHLKALSIKCLVKIAYSRCSKCPPFVRTYACRRFLHSLTAASTMLCYRPLQSSTSRCLSSSTLLTCVS